MKHTYIVILAVLLVIALAIPAFAESYNGVTLPDVYSAGKPTDYYYLIIPNGEVGGEQCYSLFIFSSPIKIFASTLPSTLTIPAGETWWEYRWDPGDNSWTYRDYYKFTNVYNKRIETITWTNFDIYDRNGNFFYDGEEPAPPTCDGSACPATDLDHNNICDDCGNILAFSLRSDLLTYAYSHMQQGLDTFPSAEYWLITDNTEGGYTIHIATEPFTYGMSTGVLSSNGAIYSSSVIQMESGQNGGRGWKNLSAGTPLEYGNPVESSHEIKDFFPDPLWKEMEKVTQGAIVAEQIRINRTMGILTVLGVGCLALLIVLTLFGKRSLIFLRR